MFQPKTYFERRVLALESLMMRYTQIYCNDDGSLMGRIIGPYNQEIAAIKTDIVDETLGPVDKDLLSTTKGASIDFVYETLQLNFGKHFFAGNDVFEADDNCIGHDDDAFKAWVADLPNMYSGVFNPDTTPQFATDNADELTVTLFIFALNGEMYAFGGMAAPFAFCIHTDGLDAEIFTNRLWTSELYNYRQDLSRSDLFIQLGQAMKTANQEVLYVSEAEDEIAQAEIDTAKAALSDMGVAVVVKKPVKVVVPAPTPEPDASDNGDNDGDSTDVPNIPPPISNEGSDGQEEDGSDSTPMIPPPIDQTDSTDNDNDVPSDVVDEEPASDTVEQDPPFDLDPIEQDTSTATQDDSKTPE